MDGRIRRCSGDESCQYMMVETASVVGCQGNKACYQAIVDQIVDQNSYRGDLQCYGNEACVEAQFFDTNTVSCDGLDSCRGASIFGPSALYARGSRSLEGANIYSCYGEGCDRSSGGVNVRDITIYAEGHHSMYKATLTCYP